MSELTTAPTIVDLCRSYGWQLDNHDLATQPNVNILYCPITRQAGVHAITLLHAMGGITAARTGTRVVYAMESSVFDPCWRESMLGWFTQANVSDEPDFIALDDDEFEQHEGGGSQTSIYPIGIWQIARRFADTLQRPTDVDEFTSALKITPSTLHSANDPLSFVDTFRNSGSRISTSLLVPRGLHRLLQKADPGRVMTLGGQDEQLFWQYWDQVFHSYDHNRPMHLYFPTVITTPPDQPLMWYCAEDLIHAIDRSVANMDLHNPNAYVAWLLRQAYLLGKRVLDNCDEPDTARSWEELTSDITSPATQRRVATAITRYLLQVPAEPTGYSVPRQA